MQNEFIWNDEKTALINVHQIVRIYLDSPAYEQKYFRVVCSVVMQGTSTLFKGTRAECETYLADFYYKH